MKVLILNDMFEYGGAELHARLECQLLREAGHECELLCVEPASRTGEDFVGLGMGVSALSEARQRFVSDRAVAAAVRSAIESRSPDVVHIHNVNLLGRSMLAAIAPFRVIQTIHDYSFICPKGTAVDDDEVACEGFRTQSCYRHCGLGARGILKRASFGRMFADRRAVGIRYISPSSDLARRLTECGVRATVIQNPYVGAVEEFTSRRPGRFLYVGLISPRKGVRLLLKAWEQVAASLDGAQLTVAGSVESGFEAEFGDLLAQLGSSVCYRGQVGRSEVLRLYGEAFCVVVPSIWLENYPTTVLEAQAQRTLVVGASRGGIPEMVGDDRCLVDVLGGSDALAETLTRVAGFTVAEYKEIVDASAERVARENSPERYVTSLEKVLAEV